MDISGEKARSGRGSRWLKVLALAAPILAGCESQLVNLELPDAAPAGTSFKAKVDHEFVENLEAFGTDNGTFIFAATAPDDWSVEKANYKGSLNAQPLELSVTVSDTVPISSSEILECRAAVTLRDGPSVDADIIATLFSGEGSQEFTSRTADAFDLSAYANGSLYVVLEANSCLISPEGLMADNLVLDAGTGNLLANPSFESGFNDWSEDSDGGCVSETLEQEDITSGVGGWQMPAPSDGTYMLATDANSPGLCLLYQQVEVPGSAGATTFTGEVGSNFGIGGPEGEVLSQAIIDLNLPEAPPGMQVIWFQTDTLPSLGFMTGDGGTLTVTFVAEDEGDGPQQVTFSHGHYSEYPEEDLPDIEEPQQNIGAATANAPSAWRQWMAGSKSVSLAQASSDQVVAAAAPGYVGLGLWFMDEQAPVPQSVDNQMTILPGPPEEPQIVPVMSGVMLLILSIGMALVGLGRSKNLARRR